MINMSNKIKYLFMLPETCEFLKIILRKHSIKNTFLFHFGNRKNNFFSNYDIDFNIF